VSSADAEEPTPIKDEPEEEIIDESIDSGVKQETETTDESESNENQEESDPEVKES
jgi:hypothetical protein